LQGFLQEGKPINAYGVTIDSNEQLNEVAVKMVTSLNKANVAHWCNLALNQAGLLFSGGENYCRSDKYALTSQNPWVFATREMAIANWQKFGEFLDFSKGPFVVKVGGMGGTGVALIRCQDDWMNFIPRLRDPNFPLGKEVSDEELKKVAGTARVIVEPYQSSNCEIAIHFTVEIKDGKRVAHLVESTEHLTVAGSFSDLGNRSLEFNSNQQYLINRILEVIAEKVLLPREFIGPGTIDLLLREKNGMWEMVKMLEINPRAGASRFMPLLAEGVLGKRAHFYATAFGLKNGKSLSDLFAEIKSYNRAEQSLGKMCVCFVKPEGEWERRGYVGKILAINDSWEGSENTHRNFFSNSCTISVPSLHS
jgi:hypothetical protein